MTSWPRHVLAVGLALACLAVLADELRGASVGWYHQDDMVNLQWVLQFRERPWAAVTELHAVHGHVRPGVLLATWAGAMLSAGAWWGPHTVLVVLVVLGLAALAALGLQRGGPLAAALAVFLALGLAGVPDLLGWNAWVSSAGEIAFGLWALVAAGWALRIGSVAGMVAAAGACVVAGSFKEPGWLLYPAVIAALSLPAWKHAAGRAGLALVPLGLLGFTLTFRPENLDRISETAVSLDHLSLALGHLLHAFPSPTWTLGHHGLGALLVGVGFGVRPLGVRSTRPWLGPFLGLALAALWAAWPPTAWLLVPLALVTLVRDRHEPPVGLVLATATLALSSLTMYASPVYTLTAGYGLALFVATELTKRRGWFLFAAGLVHHAAFLADRASRPDAPVPEQLASKARVEGLAALVHATGAPHLILTEGDPEGWLVALLGVDVVQAPNARGLQVAEGVLLQPTSGWPTLDLLDGAERTRSGRGVRRRTPEQWRVSVSPGLYALGRTTLQDACGVTHRGPTTLRVDPGCSPLTLEEAPTASGGYLVALEEPAYDLASGSIPELLEP